MSDEIAMALMAASILVALIGMLVGAVKGDGFPGWSMPVMMALWDLALIVGMAGEVLGR